MEKRTAHPALLPTPKNDHESLLYGNALAAFGNYPLGTDGCFTVGISGGCGIECFVYLRGQCTEPDEMKDRLTDEELKRHNELYKSKAKAGQE